MRKGPWIKVFLGVLLWSRAFALNMDSIPVWNPDYLVQNNELHELDAASKDRDGSAISGLSTHGYKTMQVTVGDGGTQVDQELRLSIQGFVGDSVTEGTKNGGCPWYEPIEEYIVNKEVTNYSKGGCTVSYMIDHINDIPVANLYVIALGTNDIRYRNESTCAMTSSQYVSKIDTLRKLLSEKSANAKFVFIAPWYSTDGDPYSKLSFKDKTSMTESYSSALANYCSNNNYGFINANDYIKSMLTYNPDRKFLLDHIHPNASEGVIMYSQAVLLQK